MNQPMQSFSEWADEPAPERPVSAGAGSSAVVETVRLEWLGVSSELFLTGGLLPTKDPMAMLTATALCLVRVGDPAGGPTWFSGGPGGDPVEILGIGDDGPQSVQDLS
ncbi:MAG: hypothetical protein ABWZ98_11920 [Nakamurella sp.]